MKHALRCLSWSWRRRAASVEAKLQDNLQATERAIGEAQGYSRGLRRAAEDVTMALKRAARRATGAPCPVHDGQIHGREADELRSGLERMLAGAAVSARAVQRLLDRVDARDSLAATERRIRKGAA